jgi:exosortase J
MMFAPDFGMMIVPGCNGVRGSITLFYLALIFGYTQRLPARALAALGLGAFLMGYALNLTRLCVLVIYYKIGLSWTSIQAYGVGIDYAIGCTIFLFATLSIGIAVRVYRQRHDILPETPLEAPERTSASLLPRAICFAALVLAFAIPQARAIVAAAQPKPTAEQVVAAMPPSVGSYRLTRTWTEHDTNGHVSLVMGDYTGPDSKRLTLGLWMGGESHFVANSKLYQGIRPQWNGAFDAMAQGSLPIHFLGNFYNDGVSRSYDAETACSSAGCRETLVLDKRTGLVFSAPSVAELAVAHTRRRLPILLRREWTDNAVPDAELRKSFEADARDFVSHLAIAPLIEQSGTYE